MTDLELSCIQSWRNILTDYEIKLWNEQTFDYSIYPFAAKAYILEKFAFVSDVCRLHALYSYGGIYLDTDMLVLKGFDDLFQSDLFLGEEKIGLVNAAILGSTKKNPVIREWLLAYRKLAFDYEAPLDIPTFLNANLDRAKVLVYPSAYFYPLPFSERGKDFQPFVKNETYTVHLWNHSWKNEWHFLHDKNFKKALSQYFRHFFTRPMTFRKASFLVQFGKYYFAHLFPGIYRKVKGQS